MIFRGDRVAATACLIASFLIFAVLYWLRNSA